MCKARQSSHQTADSRGQGDARAAGWSGARPARHQHHGILKEYNERTANQAGSIVPAEITVYEDRSFTFITKTPPAADLLKKAAGVDKGSGTPGKAKRARLRATQLREIAQTQDERPQRDDRRGGRAHHRRHRALDGHHRRLSVADGRAPCMALCRVRSGLRRTMHRVVTFERQTGSNVPVYRPSVTADTSHEEGRFTCQSTGRSIDEAVKLVDEEKLYQPSRGHRAAAQAELCQVRPHRRAAHAAWR